MIAVCPNPFRDINCDTTKKIISMLEEAGFKTCVCPIFLEDAEGLIPADIRAERLEDKAELCRLIIVVGGDGTILAAARQLHDVPVPILGINLGTKGFMTTLEPDELEHVVPVAQGKYRLSTRMKLDVAVIRDGQVVFEDNALNDTVMHGYGDCIKMTVSCNEKKMMEFSGDGIILSTPTGSTGYSMSAGGPIVEPNAENIIVSPICPHVMGCRPFVLGADNKLAVRMERLHGRRAYLALDGNPVLDLANEDIVLVKRSAKNTLMADVGIRSFYEITYEKLR